MDNSLYTFWGQLTARNLWLSWGVACLGVAFVLDAGVRVYDAWRGIPQHIVAACTAGISQPGVIPEAVALDYAAKWLEERYTFRPETVDAVHATIQRSLHPRLSVTFAAQAKDEAKEIRKAKMSSDAKTLRTTLRAYAPRQVTVQVDGLQTITIGQEQVTDDPITLVLTLVPYVSSGVPSGLLVARVQEPSPTKFLKR